MKRFAFPRVALMALAAFATIYACSDSTSPPSQTAVPLTVRLAFAVDGAGSTMQSGKAHLVVRHSDGVVALDTLIGFGSGSGNVAAVVGRLPSIASQTQYVVDVLVPTRAGSLGEDLMVDFDLTTAAGSAVFHAARAAAHVVPGETPAPVDLILTYVGPGATATRVAVTPPAATVGPSGTTDLTAAAFDAAGAAQSVPIVWSSLDPTVATVPDPTVGHVVAGGARGTARIRATAVNNVSADAIVTVMPPAAAIAVQGGNAQTGTAGSALPLPLVAKVTALDGGGVPGVAVTFAIQSGGGSLASTQVTTDADGLASVVYTLGQTPGTATITATATGLTGSPLAFTETATTAAGSQLAFTTQPLNTVAGATLAAVVVEARDQGGNRLTGYTGPVTLALASPPVGVTVLGTLTVNAVAGVATFSTLQINTASTALRFSATAAGIATGATSDPFNVVPGAATSLVFSAQPGTVAALDPMNTIVVQVKDAQGNLATNYAGTITVGLENPPGGLSLLGALSAVASGGVASFSGLSVSAQVASIRMTAVGTGVTGTFFSAPFVVGPPTNPLAANPPSATFTVQRLAASPAPVAVQLTSLTTPIGTLAVGTIQYGPGATGWLAAGIAPATTPATLTLTPTTNTLPAGSFTATVPITGAGGNSLTYNVTLTVTPLPVTQIAVITDPAGAESGANFITQPVVELRDATGTRVTTASNNVTASVNSGGGTLGGSLTMSPVNGRVTFTNLKITGTGATTLAYNATGLTGVVSGSFTVASALSTTQAVGVTTTNVNVAPGAFTPVTASNGVPPYAFALTGGALPTGMSFSTTTGQITGTPTSALATTFFTVTVTDAALVTSFKTFQLTVNAALSTTQAVGNKAGTVNTAIPAFTPVTASGGSVPYAFALSGGTLPTGMNFSTTTGQITGTPTTTLATTTFTVTVTDAATATSFKTFDLTVNSALTTTQAVATKTGTVSTAIPAFTPVTASAGTAPYTFALSGGSLPTGMSFSTTTGQVTGTPTTTLATKTFTVTVTDAATATSSKSFDLTVNSALTTTQAVGNTTGNNGTPLTVTPVTASGGTVPYTFALSPSGSLPTGLSFSTTTGQITGTPTASLPATTFTVTVTDAASAISSKTFQLTINGPLTTIQAVPAKVGTLNTAIPAFIPVVPGGGTSPYSFALSGGTLPTGMSFSTTTGQVSGTPTATLGITTFTVTVTDAVLATSSKTFDLTVNSALVTTQAVGTTTTDVNFALPAFTPVTASGGTAPYTFALTGGALPAGMSFNTATGQVSGTPTATLGTTIFTVTATDAANATSFKTFQLTVNSALSTTQAVGTKNGTVNTAIAAFTPVTAAGGTTPYAFALSGGTLPTGMSFSTTTGQITGTPTTTLGTTTFTVTVTDAVTVTSSKTFDLTVNGALTTTQAVGSKAGTINIAIPAFTPVTAAGGTTPYTFALSGGALPTGMSFSTTTGQITGTPTATLATKTYTVTVTDAATATSAKSFDLTVNSALVTTRAVGSVVGNSGTALAAVTPVTASGGTTPYAFALSGGTLPTGLNFSTATGQLTGTPTTTLSATTFTVTVTDAATAVSSKTFNLTVNGPLTTTQAVATKAGTVNTAIPSFTPVTASGGTLPYTFALSGGSLPTGMSFNTTNGLVSGTPTTTLTTNTFTVTVTDAVLTTSSKTFDLTVNSALVTTPAVPTTTGVVNTALTPFTPVTASGGTLPYGFALTGTLPTGVSFSTTTGQVSGTPTATLGTTSFTVTVTDNAGAVSSQTFSFTVNPPLSTTQAVASTTGVINTTIPTFTPVTASGGVGPYAFALSGGSLPSGMSFNTANGQVSGTPNATLALTTFTVTVTDATLATSSKTFDLTVNSSPPGIVLDVGASPTAAATVSGGAIAVPINVDMTNAGGANIAAITVTVSWDPTKFSFNAAGSSNGSWGGAFILANPGASSITISGTVGTGSTVSFNLYNLSLTPLAAGVTPVTGSVSTAKNESSVNVTVTPRNLSVTITP